MTEEIFYTKGEPHFVRPHSYENGNGVKCYRCRYFHEDEKQREKHPYNYMGECHSKACEADRSHIFTRKCHWNDFCHWWFPIEPQAGEQEELI